MIGLREIYKTRHKNDMCPNCYCIHNLEYKLCGSCTSLSAKPIMISQESLDQIRADAPLKSGFRLPLGEF